MGIPWSKLVFDDYCLLLSCGLTAIIQSATLVRVIQGSKHKFVIKILAMLISYNLTQLAGEGIYINAAKTDFSYKKWEIAKVFDALGYLLFSISHWMFAFKYYTMSRQSPYKIAKKEVPQRILKHDQITNWVFLTLNTLPPILYEVGFTGYLIANSNNHADLSNKLF